MDCPDCATDRNLFSPACLHCGGRYLRAIQRRQLPPDAKRTWLRKVLADWMALGHEEAALRNLAAGRPVNERKSASKGAGR